MTELDLATIDAERERIRTTYLKPEDERPASSARGLHHFAVVCSDVEETVRFYQELLEFPLTEIFENRDYPGSNHFFFDIAAGLVVSALGYGVAIGIDRVRLRNPYPGLAPGLAGA